MDAQDIFQRAIAIIDAEARTRFLEGECASQPELRKALDEQIAEHFRSQSLTQHERTVKQVFSSSTATDDKQSPPVHERTVKQVFGKSTATDDKTGIYVSAAVSSDLIVKEMVIAGKYTLLDVIGEGGMGSVWRARQTEPVKRFVAVKLIKAGMDSKQVMARFEAERQALALMDHPNIAKVFDGGLHDQRPYFVMEFVQGIPITDYCDRYRLTPQQRLELFMPVCLAIQHAHQKGIIHRDIKPSNVLVTVVDDKPVVKVIDFGVAKATGGMLTEKTLDTGLGVVGTPEYMSPEQATFNNIDIDTRSDVYSLGVLLYELLTGSPPFSNRDLKKKGLMEMLRVVREEEPPRPSTKLSTADALPSLSANRGTEPKRLTSLLRNELDWIVMKALEKDRIRRYETANGFAADVQRYLSGEPVQAHPPSRAYRLKKFVRRNSGQVIAASLILIALLAGIAGTTWQWIRAEQSAVAEKAANAKAQTRLTQVENANNLLKKIFEELDIRKVKAGAQPLEVVLVKKIIDAVQNLGDYIGDPLLTAGQLEALGVSVANLGSAKDAIPLFEKSLAIRSQFLGMENADTLTSLDDLGYGFLQAEKYDQAVPRFQESLRLRKVVLGPTHRDTMMSMNNLAAGFIGQGQLEKALPLLEETLRLKKETLGADDPDTLSTMNNLAEYYRSAGKLDKALTLFEETLKRMKARLGADHPDTLICESGLAWTYQDMRQFDKALPLWEETLKFQRRRRAAELPKEMLDTMSNLVTDYYNIQQFEKGLQIQEDLFEAYKAKFGPDDSNTLTIMNNLAAMYAGLKRLDRSIPLFQDAFERREKLLGLENSDTLATAASLGTNYLEKGRIDDAIPLLRKAYEHSATDPTLRWVGDYLLDAYVKAGKSKEAVGLIEKLLNKARKDTAAGSKELMERLEDLGKKLLVMKEFAIAEPLYKESYNIRNTLFPDTWETFYVQSLLGRALLGQKKYVDAEPLLVNGYEGMKEKEKSIPPGASALIPELLCILIELYKAQNNPNEQKKYEELRAKYPTPKKTP